MVKRTFIGILIMISVLLIIPEGRGYLHLALNLQAIDNTNHGWEVKKNSEHRQPQIPQSARDMISKYNGVFAGDPEKKVIYITIDLGYESGNTMKILDVLNESGVKATFFIVSSYLEKNPDTVDRIVCEGHSLQNHTANYRHLNTLSDNEVTKEIMALHDIVKQRYDITMKYLRPPYEDWSERVLEISSSLGYKTVFWSIACVDWVEGKGADYIYNNVMNNHHSGAVILLHAVSKDSPQALKMIINGLKSKGYEFKTLDM